MPSGCPRDETKTSRGAHIVLRTHVDFVSCVYGNRAGFCVAQRRAASGRALFVSLEPLPGSSDRMQSGAVFMCRCYKVFV